MSFNADLTASVYAKTKYLRGFFAALLMVIMLTSCAQTGGYESSPWGMMREPATTNDPNAKPGVGWQSSGERNTLKNELGGLQTTDGNIPSLIETFDPVSQQTVAVPAGAVGRTVNVALLVPLSGAKSDLGQAMLKAAQLAIFDLGAKNFKLSPKDTFGTADGARMAAQQARAENVDLILGPIFADEVRAVKPVLNGKVPMVAFSTDWTLAGGNTYVMGLLPFGQINRVTSYAASKGYRSFAAYSPATAYGDIVTNAFATAVTTHGGRLVASEKFAPSQTDLMPQITAFAQQSAPSMNAAGAGGGYDALLLPLGGESLRTAAVMFAQHGSGPRAVKMLGTGLWDDASVGGEPAVEGGWYAAPDPSLRRDFERRYLETYGVAAPRLSTLAYDATALAVVLGKSPAGNSSPYDHQRMTASRGFAGLDGIFRFRNDGLAERGLAVLEVVPGGTRVIDPAPKGFVGR